MKTSKSKEIRVKTYANQKLNRFLTTSKKRELSPEIDKVITTLEKNTGVEAVNQPDMDREIRKHILPLLTKVKFYSIKDGMSQISQEDYKFIAEKLTFDFYNAGDIIFNAGDSGDKFYIILRGTVSILVPLNEQLPNPPSSTNLPQHLRSSSKIDSKAHTDSKLSNTNLSRLITPTPQTNIRIEEEHNEETEEPKESVGDMKSNTFLTGDEDNETSHYISQDARDSTKKMISAKESMWRQQQMSKVKKLVEDITPADLKEYRDLLTTIEECRKKEDDEEKVQNGQTLFELIVNWESLSQDFDVPGLDEIINQGLFHILACMYKDNSNKISLVEFLCGNIEYT